MTSNRPDAAPGSDQMFVMGTPCSVADDSRRRRQVWGDKDTTSSACCPNSRSRAADGPAGNAQLPETLRERRRRRAERHSPLALPQRPAAMRVGQRALSTGVRVLLRKRPAANQPVTEHCFELREGGCGPVAAADMLYCRTLYLSVDPFLRCRFNESTGVDYTQPYQPGEPLTSAGIGQVIACGQRATGAWLRSW